MTLTKEQIAKLTLKDNSDDWMTRDGSPVAPGRKGWENEGIRNEEANDSRTPQED